MKISEILSGYWLDKQREFSNRTFESYSRVYRYLTEFLGDVPFDQITADDIRRFLDHLATKRKLSKRSVHDAWVPLSSLWTWAEKELGAPHIIRGKIAAPKFPKTVIEPFTAGKVHSR